MRSDDLTPTQCRVLQEQLAPKLGYLNKLLHRMQNKDFPLDDPLWQLVSRAHATMQNLVTEVRCQAAEANQNKVRPSSG